jgi:hypothetical protein
LRRDATPPGLEAGRARHHQGFADVQSLFDHHDSGGHNRTVRVMNRYVDNLPPMPGVFPDYPAPVVFSLSQN